MSVTCSQHFSNTNSAATHPAHLVVRSLLLVLHQDQKLPVRSSSTLGPVSTPYNEFFSPFIFSDSMHSLTHCSAFTELFFGFEIPAIAVVSTRSISLRWRFPENVVLRFATQQNKSYTHRERLHRKKLNRKKSTKIAISQNTLALGLDSARVFRNRRGKHKTSR